MAYLTEEENPLLGEKPWYYLNPKPEDAPETFDTQVEPVVDAAPGLPEDGKFTIVSQPPPKAGELPEGKFTVQGQYPRSGDTSQWDDTDKNIWKQLSPEAKKYFLEDTNAAKTEQDIKARRDAIASEEFKAPENWADLTREEKTKAQEDFQTNKRISLESFDTAEKEKAGAYPSQSPRQDIIGELQGEKPMGVLSAFSDELSARTKAAVMSPGAGVTSIVAGLTDTLAHLESVATGERPEDTTAHQLATGMRLNADDLMGPRKDTILAQIGQGNGHISGICTCGDAWWRCGCRFNGRGAGLWAGIL